MLLHPPLSHSDSLIKFTSIESVMPASQLILCCPLLLLPSVPASIRVFSNESMPGSSLSRVQGYPQDGWWWRMNEWITGGDQASVSEARHFIFRAGFYTLSCTLSKVKNAESTQHSISITFYRYQVLSCKSYFLYIIFWPGGLLTFYDPFW